MIPPAVRSSIPLSFPFGCSLTKINHAIDQIDGELCMFTIDVYGFTFSSSFCSRSRSLNLKQTGSV
jgi:hypothetical protein